MANHLHSAESAMAAAVAAAAQLAMAGAGATVQLYHEPSATAQVFSTFASSTKALPSTAANTVPATIMDHHPHHDRPPLAKRTKHSNNINSKPTVSSDEEQSVVAPVSTPSGETEEDAEQRLAKSRERNREHARRTRLRKKAQLEALQERVKALEQDNQLLRQSMEECSMASILLGISGANSKEEQAISTLLMKARPTERKAPKVSLAVAGKRKRFVSEGGDAHAADLANGSHQQQLLCLKMEDGTSTFIGGGKTHINWKSGVYCDESGHQRQLTQEQLENLRRERNRMHAKMTRDRKKSFISAIEQNIEELEADNTRMRSALEKVAKRHAARVITPASSPALTASPSLSPGRSGLPNGNNSNAMTTLSLLVP